ncbi:hypothetical protein [Sphingomonas sp. PP-CE-1G-424]|uniref:hypothetical protein n=1 Tax=Sphingomonas sp. PP-CE-1G-424 TaxID=2135658 RepID=UPI0010546729|nr:hypothetical protein [Sphingomonas sp. PP-CE-1G-424]
MKATLAFLPLVLAGSPIMAQQLSFKAAEPDPAAIRIMDLYARCAVGRDPKEAARIVASDYDTHSYRAEIRRFAMQQKGCVPRAGSLTFQPVIFAGMMAEDLMRRRHVDISALDHMPAPPTPNGVIACVVRTQSAKVSDLFRTLPASSGEAIAITRLQGVVADCLPREQAPITNKVILRAQLALVSYRFVAFNNEL